MEKWKSRDPSTGLHPFLPPFKLPVWRVLLQGSLLYPLRLPTASLFLFLRAVLLLPILLLRLLRLNFLARPLTRCSDALLRVVLLSLGVLSSSPKGRLHASPSHGDLIFVNHASYLDIPYLTAVFSPACFVVPYNGMFVILSPLAALRWTFTGSSAISRMPTVKSLKEVILHAQARSRGPLVIFAEGVASNGVGVLRFASFVLLERGPVYAVGLCYSRSRIECATVDSMVTHFFGLVANWKSEISARISHVPDCSTADLQREVARLAGVPPLRIGSESRLPFVQHWRSSSGGLSVEQYKQS